MRRILLIMLVASLFGLYSELWTHWGTCPGGKDGAISLNDALKNYLTVGTPYPHWVSPWYDSGAGLIERGDDGSYEYSFIDASRQAISYPRYEGVRGLIERGGGDDFKARIRPSDDYVSTFSVDVDTASYSFLRRCLKSFYVPRPDQIRIEEILNSFRYEYSQPGAGEAFEVHSEVADCPWTQGKLVRIGLQTSGVSGRKKAPANLVLLVDVSGSMLSDDKLPLVKAGLHQLVESLGEDDLVSLVTYAGSSKVLLRPTPGSRKSLLNRAIEDLEPEGFTNGSGGILAAYDLARENYSEDKSNRVMIFTDGDFNVGLTSQDELESLIRAQRDAGIYLSVLGVGSDLNDATMEQLADQGNGIYAYLDTPREAEKVLVKQASSMFSPVADDVKVQVVFNRDLVKSFRQVGYDNRQLETEDFENDRVDAGEVGEGHQVTALYEMDLLRPTWLGEEVAQVKIRYKRPGETWSRERLWTVRAGDLPPSEDFLFQTALADVALYWKGDKRADFDRAFHSLEKAVKQAPSPERREILKLAEGVRPGGVCER